MTNGRSSQYTRTKSIIQCVLDVQSGNGTPEYIIDILSRRGAIIEDFEAFQQLVCKDHLKRRDMYTLLFPHNTTEHGKILYSHLIGLRGKKNIKASVRACFTHLVSRKKLMEEEPILIYQGGEFFKVY